ncbi:MAG: ribosome maturation factor RimM [Bacilli bacterium]|jgi:16S rRNA processing protein RimM
MAEKKIGRIVNTYGIKGQLKISVTSSTAEDRFAVGKKVTIINQLNKKETYLIKTEMIKNSRIIIIGLDGFDDINQITWMVGRDVFASVRAPKGTFFYDDLVGMMVVDYQSKEIGPVANVTKMPGGDYLVIGNFFVPFKENLFVESVDSDKKIIKLTKLGSETCK